MKKRDKNTEDSSKPKVISFPGKSPGVEKTEGDSIPTIPQDASAVDLEFPEHLTNLDFINDMPKGWEPVDKDVMSYSYEYMVAALQLQGLGLNLPATTAEKDVRDKEEVAALNEEFSNLAAMLPGESQDRIAVYATAGYLYDSYCDSVGNVNFNGDPLPLWDTFAADPEKEKQTRAWIEIGRIACCIKFSGYHRGYGIAQAMKMMDLKNNTGGQE